MCYTVFYSLIQTISVRNTMQKMHSKYKLIRYSFVALSIEDPNDYYESNKADAFASRISRISGFHFISSHPLANRMIGLARPANTNQNTFRSFANQMHVYLFTCIIRYGCLQNTNIFSRYMYIYLLHLFGNSDFLVRYIIS